MQFSWYCDGKGDEPRPTKDGEIHKIYEYVIRTPNLKDITDGSTHYRRLDEEISKVEISEKEISED